MDGLEVKAWPALWEAFQLFVFLMVIMAGVLGAVWLNFRTWRSHFYLPTMLLLGVGVGALVYYAHDILMALGVIGQSAAGGQQAMGGMEGLEGLEGIDFGTAESNAASYRPDWTLVFYLAIIPLLNGSFFRFVLKGRFQTPVYFIAPAVFSIALLFMYPFLFNIYLAFTRLNLTTLNDWIETGRISFAGIDNFVNVFKRNVDVGDEPFWLIAWRTVLWTGANVALHAVFGMLIALLMNQKIRLVGLYRTLLIVPWVAPQMILILIWRMEFHAEYGAINQITELFMNFFGCYRANGCYAPVEWLSNPAWLFAACTFINVWLGIPFYAVTCLSGLQAISPSYYEAASMDGASRWKQFWNITLPMMKPVIIPVLILDMIWTFNMANVIWLMTAQRGGTQGADIFVTDLYKQAFTYNRYSFAAAYSLLVFAILGIMSFLSVRASKVNESANAR